MEERDLPAAPSDLNAKYEDAIRKKLVALMRASGYSQIHFCEMLQERGLGLEQGNLSSMLKGRKHIPLSLIVHICDIFKISLAELVDENFGGARQVGGSSPAAQVYSDDLLQLIPDLGSKFIVDPSDSHFFGYLQTYHVYMFPSQGDDSRIRTGKLRLQTSGGVCEAILEINTNKIQDGVPYVKTYHGRCIISTTMRSVFILLTDREKGELSIMNFRYFHLLQYPLDCRIACTLLNATGPEHPPTMERMFLSRMEIAKEHIPLLIPHLHLNSGIIRIHQDHLEDLRNTHSEYNSLIDELLRTNQPHTIYHLDEDDVLSTARRCLCSDELPGSVIRNPENPAVNLFLTRLRSFSDQPRLNKASRQADHLAHRLLRSLGYYHDFEN